MRGLYLVNRLTSRPDVEVGARLSGEAFGKLEDDAAGDLNVERAVVEVLIADRHRSEGRQVQRHAASVLQLRIRGGIYTTVVAEYRKEGWTPVKPVELPEFESNDPTRG